MIRAAQGHRDALQAAYVDAIQDPRCRWYVTRSWQSWKLEIDDTDFHKMQRVSVASDGTLHGYLAAGIDRDLRAVDWLAALSFRPGSLVFQRDLFAFLHGLFTSEYTRVIWKVTAGNPAEAMYDRAVASLGARKLGPLRRDVRALDGEVHDSMVYELLPDDIPGDGLLRLARLAGMAR